MTDRDAYRSDDPIAWCPGCGNFGILNALKGALARLDLKPEQVLMVSGIGQAAKLPHYLRCNTFNGLHGRTLPVAAGARIANPGLTVIAVGGDGDGYAEGGNHFLHAMRRNLDLTYLVHNNQVYGLTKGQASPTSDPGMVTGTTPKGLFAGPERPLALAVAGDCGFVARGFAGEMKHLSDLIEAAIRHEGFSFVEILQPCVSFNKVNTFDWYKDRVYFLEGSAYGPADRGAAFEKALEWGEKIPLGVLYRSGRKTYEELAGLRGSRPLAGRELDESRLTGLFDEFT
jgi:2-oxoglutarate ferredoxin oxidoreductase subunit beta